MAILTFQIGFSEAVKNNFQAPHPAEDRLSRLASLNLFIGPNNSGKSRLMRHFFMDDKLLIAPNLPSWKKAYEFNFLALRYLNQSTIPQLYRQSNPIDQPSTHEVALQILTNIPLFSHANSYNERANALTPYLRAIRKTNVYQINQYIKEAVGIRDFCDQLHSVWDEAARINHSADAAHGQEVFKRRVYIPTLRSLRLLTNKNEAFKDPYFELTSKEYFPGLFHQSRPLIKADSQLQPNTNERQLIYTGQGYYQLCRNMLLGAHEYREKFRAFEAFLSERFFRHQRITIIPREDQHHLTVKIGEDSEFPIHELGDGIQQIILMTLPMFLFADSRTLFFIEEPETHLHPGLQRQLIETILTGHGHEHRQVFVTTHSQQFLDLTLDHEDISVYHCRRSDEGNADQPKFIVANTSHQDRQLLLELGVFNSSVLLANCTIWVEGITDRLYLRHYFKLYQDHLQEQASEGQIHAYFREDIHFAFVEYGGVNLQHWSIGNADDDPESIQTDYLCGKGFLICDRNDQTKKKWEETLHAKLREKLGESFHVLPVREIENLISPDVLVRVIREREGQEDLAIKSFDHSKYVDRYLGKFIENQLLTPIPHQPRRRYAENGTGTIRNKTDFCREVLAQTKTFADLSQSTIDLCEKLYSFIAQHQPRD